ncbi:hypothetical protein N0V90_008423 [Kalmusia sp. IMI 367209]|nr:hypothetical protein N0V90_008423 [Kalmusia sp. IMI 367209]
MRSDARGKGGRMLKKLPKIWEPFALRPIPESFIWFVFKALVQACLILRDGSTNSKRSRSSWKPITHKDIAVRNIFLGDIEERKDSKGKWPRICLADFGEAFFNFDSAPDHSENPGDYVLQFDDERGDRAPELIRARNKFTRIDEKTDVWAIGCVIYDLMINMYSHAAPNVDGFEVGPVREDKPLPGKKGKFLSVNARDPRNKLNTEDTMFSARGPYRVITRGYSDELKIIVRRCLEYRPVNRPSMPGLMRLIYEAHPKNGLYWKRAPDLSALDLRTNFKNELGKKWEKQRPPERPDDE